jgi:hypothetical protein
MARSVNVRSRAGGKPGRSATGAKRPKREDAFSSATTRTQTASSANGVAAVRPRSASGSAASRVLKDASDSSVQPNVACS